MWKQAVVGIFKILSRYLDGLRKITEIHQDSWFRDRDSNRAPFEYKDGYHLNQSGRSYHQNPYVVSETANRPTTRDLQTKQSLYALTVRNQLHRTSASNRPRPADCEIIKRQLRAEAAAQRQTSIPHTKASLLTATLGKWHTCVSAFHIPKRAS
jgi:hypothetical protein